MITLRDRQIRSWQSARLLPDLLQSIFAAELLVPSTELYLVSPWISDIPILDNRTGEFTALVPEWDYTHIRLSQVLLHLARWSVKVYVGTRVDEHSRPFLRSLQCENQLMDGKIAVQEARLLHEKGLLGDGFYLSGSFNFTFYGITMNEEVAHLSTDPTLIAENRIAFRERWT